MNKSVIPRLTELADGVYRIAVPLEGTPLGTINAYLIPGDDRHLLIDTGYRMRRCITAIEDSFRELGLSLEDTDILLTHFHNDHAGAATELIRPGRRIYVPQQEFSFFDIGGKSSFYRESRRPLYEREGMGPEDFDRIMRVRSAGAVGPDFLSSQFVPVRDGEILSAGNIRLQAIHTPGHTPGHFCYWDAAHGILFTGDHVLFDITPNIIPWAGIPNILGTYLYSLEKIRDLPAQLALPGHRTPGPLQERVDALLHHHDLRLKECEALVHLYPGRTALELTRLLSWNVHRTDGREGLPFHLLRYAFGECLAHLDHLRFQGRIRRTEGDDGFWHYR